MTKNPKSSFAYMSVFPCTAYFRYNTVF